MSPSFNHSYIQVNLGAAFKKLNTYTVLSELSIEINGKEYETDLCLYSKRKMQRTEDIVRMTEVPLLAVEILSTSQTIKDATDKFKIYFGAGVKSCWLIEPFTQSVTVFQTIHEAKTFFEGLVIDPIMDLKIEISEVFD